MQAMFWLYGLLGAVAFLLYRPLSPAVEAQAEAPPAPLGQSRRIVYGLAALFSIDAFGGGFFVQSLLVLWLYQAYGLSIATAGSILFWSGLLSALSFLLAVPISDALRPRQHHGVHASAVEHLPDPRAFRAESRDRDRPVAGPQRAVANGCADAQLLCHGGGDAGRAAGGRRA